MSSWYFHHLLTAAILGVTIFAWAKGGWPERLGASLNLLIAVLFLAVNLVVDALYALVDPRIRLS